MFAGINKSVEWRIGLLVAVAGLLFAANLLIGAQSRQATYAELGQIEQLIDNASASSGQDFDQAITAARSRIAEEGWFAGVIAIVSVIFCLAATMTLIQLILNPIRAQVAAMRQLSAGDIEVQLSGQDLPGGIGDMNRSILEYRNTIIKRRQLEIEAAASLSALEADRRQKDEQDRYYIEAHNAFLTKFNDALERFSNGDVQYRLEDPFIAEYEGIRHAFNTAAGKIQNAILNILARSIEIKGGTDRILAAADELSRHTEEQASSLEETSASMEQMAATIRQNASNAQEASAASVITRNLAVGGGQVAEQAVSAMEKIERSSKQMTEIVSLIEEIAFQTNILALNAAVEAARAGDAGKGFAVVANEVRALSQRSSRSLKDIKSLIDSSATDVVEGVRMVKQAGGSLTDIAVSVKKAADLVAEIAAASHEQAVGVDQVSRAVANMDEMTQQNAALVQETTASLHAAQTWINELHRVVSMFDAGAPEPTANDAETVSDANWVRSRQNKIESEFKTQRPHPSRSRRPAAARASTALDRDWQEL